ncbi:reverse transcriptase domain-containing protein [Tanacetum coccineum]
MPSQVKTYDGSEDPKDHIKMFQSAAKTKRWAMPTWCHMFNSTLNGNARHIKDPVEIHHIKQRDGESTEDFIERYKEGILDVEGMPECMKISGFMHGITHPELIKRLYERIPRLMDEMYRVTTSFLQGEVAAFSHGRKKAPAPWKQPEGGNKKNFKNKQRSDRKPDRQKKRGQAPERNKVIQEEVEKLVDAGIMKEVHYHRWLSNQVKVKKHDGSWRMCVDFKDLNKACPQGGYPLPEIDWKVKSLCGYPFKCFLDAYKGYHQIKMAKEDEEKTTFITSQGIFFYSKMPFGQKNAGATYQRLVDKAFQKQIGRNLEKCIKKSDFQWTREAEIAFKQMKKLIAELPMLTAPKEGEELIIYLAAAKKSYPCSLNDIKGRQTNASVLYGRALRGLEINYTPMEKLTLALLSASMRLKRYFQAHTIVVITDQPIKQPLSKSEISGRMLKWKFELERYDIQYRPRASIKGQVLADFIVERLEEESPNELMEEPEEVPEPWTLFTDGSSCIDGSGAGLILTNPEGVEFTYAMWFRFKAIKNEAEYEALIAGLRIAEQIGVKNLQANVDSRLVANQNRKADALSKIASISFAHLSKQILMEELNEKSINEKEVLAIVEEEGHIWMTHIYEYLTKEILPDDKKKARAVHRSVPRNPQQNLTPITSPWPFYKWGIDIAEPFPEGPGKKMVWSKGQIEVWAKKLKIDWMKEAETGTEAVIPAEIGMPTLRTVEVNLVKNEKALKINLDLIEEKKEQAAIQEAKSKAKIVKYYNAKVRGTSFKPGDMVYRSNDASHAKDGGKLGPK